MSEIVATTEQRASRRSRKGGAGDEWYTPPHVFVPLHAEFQFTVDVCATPDSAKVPRFYTKEQDGLAQSWAGEFFWCNPPYSDIRSWVQKAWIETGEAVSPERRARGGVMLVPCWMDRAWWHDWVEPARLDGRVELRFRRGRISFGTPLNPTAEGHNGGGFDPSVFIIWRATSLLVTPRQTVL